MCPSRRPPIASHTIAPPLSLFHLHPSLLPPALIYSALHEKPARGLHSSMPREILMHLNVVQKLAQCWRPSPVGFGLWD
eukprot:353758-Chlamydomonas_euryale.AAC.5